MFSKEYILICKACIVIILPLLFLNQNLRVIFEIILKKSLLLSNYFYQVKLYE